MNTCHWRTEAHQSKSLPACAREKLGAMYRPLTFRDPEGNKLCVLHRPEVGGPLVGAQ
jgi:hypothetical protein